MSFSKWESIKAVFCYKEKAEAGWRRKTQEKEGLVGKEWMHAERRSTDAVASFVPQAKPIRGANCCHHYRVDGPHK